MLVEFSVANFRSFSDKQTLSLQAASISERKENLITETRDPLLKSAVIYGANSSGKSNLIKAFEFMKWFVLYSVKRNGRRRGGWRN